MTLPIINLDNKTFEQLVEEARKYIPIYAPQWTDHNLHDPGITLVDLFAWLTEMQLYSLNLVTGRHLVKYLSLLGVCPEGARPARADVRLTALDFIEIPAGTLFYTQQTGDTGMVFESGETVEILPVEIKKVLRYSYYQFTDVTEFNRQPQSYYRALGEDPSPGDALYLGLESAKAAGDLEGKALTLAVYTYEDDLPPAGDGDTGGNPFTVYPSAGVSWEYWNGTGWGGLTVTAETGTIPVLSQSGRLSLLLPGDMYKGTPAGFPADITGTGGLFWVRCRILQAEYEIPPGIDCIIPNVITVVEGRTRQEDFESSGLPHQVFNTRYAPVVPGTLTVTSGAIEWTAAADFDASGPEDTHYTFDPVTGAIRFGNGVNGAVPMKQTGISIRYRGFENKSGTIETGALTGIDIPGVFVHNPYPSTPGAPGEDIDGAFYRIRKELLVPSIAVTAGDYETIAKATPGLRVARAKAVIPGETENRVTLVVVPYSFDDKPLPGTAFKKTLCQYIDMHRPITTPVTICDPGYVKISVSVEVTIKSGYHPDTVTRRIRDALDGFLIPIDKTAAPGTDGNAWPFGRPVYRSEVHQLLENIAGVDCVAVLTLTGADGIFEKIEGNIHIDPLSLVYPGTHQIEIIDRYGECSR